MRRRYFCLRGHMKSGTNWLGKILSTHPEIECVGEFHWQNIYAAFRKNLRTLPLFQDDPDYRRSVQHLFEDFVRNCLDKAAPNAKFVGERTPTTLDPLFLPDAPHISIIRDGRDILVSRAFHLFNYPEVHKLFDRIPEMREDFEKFQANPWFFKEHPEMLLRHETMVKESCRWWCEHFESDRKTLDEQPFLKVHFVRYEQLHEDVERERQSMFEFLGVDPTAAEPVAGEIKPGFTKERPNEFFRKGKTGDWTNYFTDETKAWFKEVAGEELIRQGYAESNDW